MPGRSPIGRVEVVLHARIAGLGERKVVAGSMDLSPDLDPSVSPSPAYPSGAAGPRVAICMATFDPPPELLRRQLDSMRKQTHGNWVCDQDDRWRADKLDRACLDARAPCPPGAIHS